MKAKEGNGVGIEATVVVVEGMDTKVLVAIIVEV